MKKIFVTVAVFLCAVSFHSILPPASVGANPEITLTWSDYAAPGYDQLNYIYHYIDRIKEETNGRVEIKLYPAQQLVKALQQYEALMQGTIDMCNFTPVYYAGKIPMLCLSSETSYWEPGDSVVITSRTIKEIDTVLSQDGIKFMGWSTELPPMCMPGSKIFRNAGDFKGLKIRAPGKASKVINSWGGTGVSIPASELYMALQKGLVDGAFTTIGTVEGTHLWEVTDCITFTRNGGSPQLVCMNMEKWNSLPADIKKSFEKVNREMVPWAYSHALNYVDKTKDFLRTKFKKSYQQTQEEHEALSEPAAGYIWKPITKKFGEPAQKLWEKTLAVAKESQEARKQGKIPRFFED